MNEFIDKTGASDAEWQRRLELFDAGLAPLCPAEHHPDAETTVHCAATTGHPGEHRSLAGDERWT